MVNRGNDPGRYALVLDATRQFGIAHFGEPLRLAAGGISICDYNHPAGTVGEDHRDDHVRPAAAVRAADGGEPHRQESSGVRRAFADEPTGR